MRIVGLSQQPLAVSHRLVQFAPLLRQCSLLVTLLFSPPGVSEPGFHLCVLLELQRLFQCLDLVLDPAGRFRLGQRARITLALVRRFFLVCVIEFPCQLHGLLELDRRQRIVRVFQQQLICIGNGAVENLKSCTAFGFASFLPLFARLLDKMRRQIDTSSYRTDHSEHRQDHRKFRDNRVRPELLRQRLQIHLGR